MQSIKLIISGTVRIKKNSREVTALRSRAKTGVYKFFGYGRNKALAPAMVFTRPGKPYQIWEFMARDEIRKQLPLSFRRFTGPVWVKVMIFYKGNKPDIHGAFESIADMMEGVIYENDGQVRHWDGSRMLHDKENPRTEIEVKELNGEL